MAEARSRDEWNRTACTMALLANLNRDPKKRAPYKPSEFHPLERERKAPVGKTGIGILKSVFVRRVAADTDADAQDNAPPSLPPDGRAAR